MCELYGSMAPFNRDKLHSLYANSDVYSQQVHDAAERAIMDGFLLPADAGMVLNNARLMSRNIR